jgi:ribose-phosphate pyrophosphokinase
LHRFKSLNEIYAMPAITLHAGPAIAAWIKASVSQPFLIGPDEESWQWFSAVAGDCSASFAILRKKRLGDRKVHTVARHLLVPKTATPVILDDIVSSGARMLEALRLIRPLAQAAPVVIAIHGILAGGT